MDLSISIVSWNTKDLLDQCLKSIYETTSGIDFEVIVVDNASSDGSQDMVKAAHPKVSLIENTENVGFATANNQAFAECTGRYLMLLNPDTIVQSNLAEIVTYMDSCDRVGVAGCLCLNPDGTNQPNWYDYYPSFFWELQPESVRNILKSLFFRRNANHAFHTKWVGGQCMTVRRSAVDSVGIMDPEYFMYSEETDWCFRVRKAGWEIWHFPGIAVTHFGGQSTSQVSSAMLVELYRSKVRFMRKNLSSWHAKAFKRGLFVRTSVLLSLMRSLPSKPSQKRQTDGVSRLLSSIKDF